MMLDMCKGLYNITINVECMDDYTNSKLCLCPDCDSFIQMCYFFNLKRKNIDLSCEEMKKDNADTDSLKCVRRQMEGEICQNIKCIEQKVVNMHLGEIGEKYKWKKLTKLKLDDQENLLFLHIMLLTMKMVFQNRNVCLTDLICAYDVDVLTRQFGKMVYKFVQDVMGGLNEQKDIHQDESMKDLLRIIEFLGNLKSIYSQREAIYKQAKNYLDALYTGMEREGEFLDWKNIIRSDIGNRLKKDFLGDDLSLEAFLLSCGQTVSENIKDRFYNNVIIIKTYVMKCQEHYQMFSKGKVDELLEMLGTFNCGRTELKQIDGLEKATFAVKESFKADTKLILNYLKKDDIERKAQESKAEEKCWNIWKIASA